MKVAMTGAIVVMCIALAGCGDQTGEIDTLGHNGYDRDTCDDSKAFALDVLYGTVLVANWRERVDHIEGMAKRAADAKIKGAAGALISSYEKGDRAGVSTAVNSLVKACNM